MRRLLLTLIASAVLLAPMQSLAAKGHSASHSSKPRTSKTKKPSKAPKASKPSKKSNVPGSNDGTYAGGKGSSHKGGKYQNPKTGNHERNRKAGVAK